MCPYSNISIISCKTHILIASITINIIYGSIPFSNSIISFTYNGNHLHIRPIASYWDEDITSNWENNITSNQGQHITCWPQYRAISLAQRGSNFRKNFWIFNMKCQSTSNVRYVSWEWDVRLTNYREETTMGILIPTTTWSNNVIWP